MIQHPIHLTWQHRILFTEGVFDPANDALLEMLRGDGEHGRRRRRVLVVIDDGLLNSDPSIVGTVAAWFARRAEHLDLRGAPIVIPGGEECKNQWEMVDFLWGEINDAGLDRHSYVAVIGGGAVLDLVGFAAATAHRGIRLIRLPTTTLSQGDGGVGVKNSVNYFGKKNWVGTFAVPFAVINDFRFLLTLPDEEKRAGYIEAIKVALIRDAGFFAEMEAEAAAMEAFDPGMLRRVIERSAHLHVRHIATSGDPFELGSARPLDFGHWAAHKLEQISNFRVHHGQAVALGICCDLLYAEIQGMLDPADCHRAMRLIENVGFSLWDDDLLRGDEHGELEILRGLEEFREHLGGDLCITLATGIGQAVEVHEMDDESVKLALHRLRAHALARHQPAAAP
jgi:3-dehydroquinate synthase